MVGSSTNNKMGGRINPKTKSSFQPSPLFWITGILKIVAWQFLQHNLIYAIPSLGPAEHNTKMLTAQPFSCKEWIMIGESDTEVRNAGRCVALLNKCLRAQHKRQDFENKNSFLLGTATSQIHVGIKVSTSNSISVSFPLLLLMLLLPFLCLNLNGTVGRAR